MKIPQKPKRWLPDKKARKGQIKEWANKCWIFHQVDNRPLKLKKCIEEFINTYIDIAEGLDFEYENVFENILKLKAYNCRNLNEIDTALNIFINGMNNNLDNFHWVIDCIDTYIKINDFQNAIELLNSKPLQLISSETETSADLILKLAETNTSNTKIKPKILTWAIKNRSLN